MKPKARQGIRLPEDRPGGGSDEKRPRESARRNKQEQTLRSWLCSQKVQMDWRRLADGPTSKSIFDGAVPMPPSEQKILGDILDAYFRMPEPVLGSATWPGQPRAEQFGRLADTRAAQFVHYLLETAQADFDALIDGTTIHRDDAAFVDWLSHHVLKRDSSLFHQIAKMIDLWTEGRLAISSPSDIGLNDTPGRKTQPYDLEVAFPIAAVHLLAYRFVFPGTTGEPSRPLYITRAEIHDELQYIWAELGFVPCDRPHRVSESHLSRFLRKSGLTRFVR